MSRFIGRRGQTVSVTAALPKTKPSTGRDSLKVAALKRADGVIRLGIAHTSEADASDLIATCAAASRDMGMTMMRDELQNVMQSLRDIPADELPNLIGQLENVKAAAWARLSIPATAPQQDRLLCIADAAERLGVSPDYLYRHSHEYSFTRRMGRKLLFSSLGIDKHIKCSRI